MIKETHLLDGGIRLWMDDKHCYFIQEDKNLDLPIHLAINHYRQKIFAVFDCVDKLGYPSVHDRTAPLPVPSLSAVLGMINKGGALTQWAANSAADHFLNNLNHGQRLQRHEIERLHREAKYAHRQKSTEALDVGTAVHAYAEAYAQHQIAGSEMPEAPMDEQVLNGINGFLDWVAKHDVRFHKTEFQLYNWNFNLAGTCDTLFECDSQLYIGDFKTSRAIYPEYEYQVAFYRYAYTALYHEVDRMAIIRFDKATGNFEFHDVPESSYGRHLVAVKGARDLHYAIKGF